MLAEQWRFLGRRPLGASMEIQDAAFDAALHQSRIGGRSCPSPIHGDGNAVAVKEVRVRRHCVHVEAAALAPP
jgi:hypothetical protein